MNAVTSEATSARLDILKWLIVVLLLAAGIYGNHHFASQPLLYRAIALVAIAAVAGYLALNTVKGDVFWQLLKGARIEARRVVWPTKQECNQTTLIVVAFIIVMALILWGLDSLFGWITSMIIG
jgi:preprotein translocase subunit SecE